mmetsp:Transcript_19576/g.30659  ORF Transcript_19576/g.30659 Transcript_19576/m.30659 type:complete len:298 (+) Transcript_19576:97-990(+)|eukprot:CAMPEP_0184307620 /NCGR_PEP_ID=MMETSP1049-20130417/16327_1 /TAXON_ID=77928 /ORGANISM="Proteomonas sulcata, Strain CCMP704" /LENGTH=297 /DNA_ID=CAMNT_0026620147 /DNA_START=51 /DNA_END=944 /DNA_ORIENTATION=+
MHRQTIVLGCLLLAASASAFTPSVSLLGEKGIKLNGATRATCSRYVRMAATAPKQASAETTPEVPEVPAVPAVPGEKAPAPAAKKEEEKKEIPEPKLESDVGADYVPLLTALRLGEWEEADQLTRDLLIQIGGEGTKKRGFVYFSEAKKLPVKDMQTIDNLWTAYSEGKFGYSVQKKIWNSNKVKGDFNKFVQEINWTNGPCGGCGPEICSGCPGILKRWVPLKQSGNEFIYDAKKAPKGHLPLTSALRGTYLLKNLLAHPAYGVDGLTGVEESLPTMDQMRFPESKYFDNKKPWDN